MDFTTAKKLAEEKATEYVGQPTAKCPSYKSCLMVVVYKADTNPPEVINGAQVQVSGISDSEARKGSTKMVFRAADTKQGLAKFTPFEPGSNSMPATFSKV